MDLIQKYAGADAKKPRLNKLGTIQWGKTKSQVKKAVQIVAKDLVELYAVRQHRQDPKDKTSLRIFLRQSFQILFLVLPESYGHQIRSFRLPAILSV